MAVVRERANSLTLVLLRFSGERFAIYPASLSN
jgi:hypothetical protein